MSGASSKVEIDGISDELCEKYSQRRGEIEERIAAFRAEYGREPTPAEIRAGTVLSIPAVAMIQVVHNRKIAANLSLLQVPLWWKLRRRQRSGRLERLLNRRATQIVL